MAEQQQSAKLVEMNKALAAGLASVVTALFTSKLGVAGTLIGTALTAITITLFSAIFKAQIERAQTKLSGLPSTVRGRLSTQQVRIPGRQGAEPNPESPPPPEQRGGRFASFVERLRSIPSFLKGLSPAARRRILLSGALAGLAGASEVAGLKGYLTADLSRGFGYAGIVVAMIAGLQPLWVLPAAIFVAGVFVGADTMSRTLNVSNYIADLIVAFSLLSVLVSSLFVRFRIRWG